MRKRRRSGPGSDASVAPAPPPRPVYTAPAEGTDHDLWVGHIGVGWFGTRDIPVGAPAASGGTIATPVVGVRYWLNPGLGIDVGLGLAPSKRLDHHCERTSLDRQSLRTRLSLCMAACLALANSRHFSFQITPELDVGFGTGTTGGAGGDIDRTGSSSSRGSRGGRGLFRIHRHSRPGARRVGRALFAFFVEQELKGATPPKTRL